MTVISINWALALIVFALLQIADVATTVQALKRGGREANPVIDKLMKFGPFVWIGVKLLFSFAAAYVFFLEDLIWILWLFNAIYLAVVLNNHKIRR